MNHIDNLYLQIIYNACTQDSSKLITVAPDDINELIENNTKNWSINRFSKIDLAILQIAIAEMLSDLNIPEKVSINQAIDLAKIYCEEKTPKFINGILGSVVDEINKR